MERCYFPGYLASLAMVSFVNADIFDRSFLLRMEDITQTNKELTQTNRYLNMFPF